MNNRGFDKLSIMKLLNFLYKNKNMKQLAYFIIPSLLC